MFGPTCPYCAGTPTYYATSTSLGGNWGPVTQLNATSCGGQPDQVLAVAGLPPAKPTYVYLSDQWQGGSTSDHNVLGSLNQALAQEYTGTLTFDAAGNIAPFGCQSSVSLPSLLGTAGSDTPLPSGWQGIDTSKGIQTSCSISNTPGQGNGRVAQIVVPTHPGTLSQIWVLAYQRYRGGTDAPNLPLLVQVSEASSSGPLGQITQVVVPPSSVSWSPSWVKITGLDIPVTQQDVDAGKAFAVTLWSATTTGCYGVGESNVAGSQGIDAYPPGGSFVSNGSTWTSRPFTDVDFRSNL